MYVYFYMNDIKTAYNLLMLYSLKDKKLNCISFCIMKAYFEKKEDIYIYTYFCYVNKKLKSPLRQPPKICGFKSL